MESSTGSGADYAFEKQVRVNLDAIQDLKPQMQKLKELVSSYIPSVQESIIKSRSEYEMKLSQLKSTENQLKSEIEMNKALRERLLEELSTEMRNKDQSSVKVGEMKLQEEELVKQRAEFISHLDDIESQISDTMKRINEQKEMMKNQTTLVNEKLFQFEQLLGLRIEHSVTSSNLQNSARNSDQTNDDYDNDNDEIDTIKFIFKNIDPSNFNVEVNFVFDPANVSIVSSEPELSDEIISEALSLFLETKEIGYLWKFMRTALRNKLLA